VINVGTFVDWVKDELTTEVIIPSGSPRPALPYITVMEIVNNFPRPHQVGREQVDEDTTRMSYQERQQFSLTAIGSSENNAAKELCYSLRDLLYSQTRKDFFAENGWKFRIITFPAARYLTTDDFGEERHGFDIEISKTNTTEDSTAGSIGEIELTNPSGKIEDIIVDEET
jgi:hypothetical protein